MHKCAERGLRRLYRDIQVTKPFTPPTYLTIPDDLGQRLGLAAPVQEAGEVRPQGRVGAVRVLHLVLLNGAADVVRGAAHDY